MSSYRCCLLDNVIVILVIFSLTTLADNTNSRQGHSKVTEVTVEGHDAPVEDNDEPLLWVNSKLAGNDDLLSSMSGRQTTTRGQSVRSSFTSKTPGTLAKTKSGRWRKKRSTAAYPSQVSWTPGKSIGAGQVDDDNWLLDAAMRHVSHLQQSPLTRQTSFFKPTGQLRTRRIDNQEEDGRPKGGDWDTNGWAGNNLRIWG